VSGKSSVLEPDRRNMDSAFFWRRPNDVASESCVPITFSKLADAQGSSVQILLGESVIGTRRVPLEEYSP